MSPGTGLRERTSEAISKVDSGVAICGGGVQSHQWEEDRDHAAWGWVDHTAWGMSGRGNEMRRWSWWNLKMERESPHLKGN